MPDEPELVKPEVVEAAEAVVLGHAKAVARKIEERVRKALADGDPAHPDQIEAQKPTPPEEPGD